MNPAAVFSVVASLLFAPMSIQSGGAVRLGDRWIACVVLGLPIFVCDRYLGGPPQVHRDSKPPTHEPDGSRGKPPSGGGSGEGSGPGNNGGGGSGGGQGGGGAGGNGAGLGAGVGVSVGGIGVGAGVHAGGGSQRRGGR